MPVTSFYLWKVIYLFRVPGPYSLLTIRKVVTPIRYDKSVSISAIRIALKPVTIRKVDLFYAPFAMQ